LKRARSNLLEEFLREADSWVGTPYKFNGCAKGRGTNCVVYALKCMQDILPEDSVPIGGWKYTHENVVKKRLNVVMPEMLKVGREISLAEIRPGDIAFIQYAGIPVCPAIYMGEERFVFCINPTGVFNMMLPRNMHRRIVSVIRIKCFDGDEDGG